MTAPAPAPTTVDAASEAALAARAGAPDAPRALVTLTQRAVWRFLAAVTGPETAVSSAAATYARAFAALPRFRGEPPALLWLLTIAREVVAASHPVPRRHQAFVLTQHLGLGYADAALVLGCDPSDVRVHVARARDDLVLGAPGPRG